MIPIAQAFDRRWMLFLPWFHTLELLPLFIEAIWDIFIFVYESILTYRQRDPYLVCRVDKVEGRREATAFTKTFGLQFLNFLVARSNPTFNVNILRRDLLESCPLFYKVFTRNAHKLVIFLDLFLNAVTKLCRGRRILAQSAARPVIDWKSVPCLGPK